MIPPDASVQQNQVIPDMYNISQTEDRTYWRADAGTDTNKSHCHFVYMASVAFL